ncbi:MAG: hypothetical protein P8O10_14015 [Pseudorhodobacter sp.]|nr:hypothetical protein [Pseudorhodobacter sp.]
MTEPTTLVISDPASADALACLTAYFGEISARFPGGFDPGPLDPVDLAAQRPPHGAFVIARRGGAPVGCVALRPDGDRMGGGQAPLGVTSRAAGRARHSPHDPDRDGGPRFGHDSAAA